MISCQNVVDFALEYLEGGLPEEEAGGFQRHLSACSDCETFFQTYRRTAELSKQALAASMPVSVKEAVRSYLRSRCTPDTAAVPAPAKETTAEETTAEKPER